MEDVSPVEEAARLGVLPRLQLKPCSCDELARCGRYNTLLVPAASGVAARIAGWDAHCKIWGLRRRPAAAACRPTRSCRPVLIQAPPPPPPPPLCSGLNISERLVVSLMGRLAREGVVEEVSGSGGSPHAPAYRLVAARRRTRNGGVQPKVGRPVGTQPIPTSNHQVCSAGRWWWACIWAWQARPGVLPWHLWLYRLTLTQQACPTTRVG